MWRDDWLAEKRAELTTLSDLPLSDLTPSRRDFTQFIATQKEGIALVARIQRRDPATGGAWPTLDVAAFARACDEAEVGALAVRTAALFDTGLADLDAVAAAATAPVLRDDFCLDRRQVYQARLHGADAILLPAADLEPAALRDLAALAGSMHMASVVEVDDPAQLATALAVPSVCIGLACAGSGGRADLARIRTLATQAPRHRTVMLLAEVVELDDLLGLAGQIDAAVVGDALLSAADPVAAIADFASRLG